MDTNTSPYSARTLMNRLVIDATSMSVVFDGRRHVFTNTASFIFFKTVAEAGGQLVTTTHLKALTGCGRRIDVVKLKVPPVLRSLLKSKRGYHGGYWLQANVDLT